MNKPSATSPGVPIKAMGHVRLAPQTPQMRLRAQRIARFFTTVA